jgi:flagellar basal-body rod protein FlgB
LADGGAVGVEGQVEAMFVERMLNQGNAPLLEQVVQFAAARHKLIAEGIANVDTPGYRQKDLSVERFQSMLRDRVDRRSASDGRSRFDDIRSEVENPERGILFHDGNNRSMEQLASDLAKNAMMHNLAIELLRKQFMGLEAALKERVT